ncbi:S41 family peptidase [Alteraurantiacibacter aquimixticola]|uniref:Peptidase S41 n=1 Tax=Alteraurantiacibacter aquimixticola TaxID=2489173 RepID=A0A4T3F2V2_9SPHN|nr:S41 family peptidase [Alteraurantiacibacter aquimixticola]TIX49755.1 peptidase S41 [Alteraurantiacibacter aquimixticola]
MKTSKIALSLACAAMLASCGGGGGNGGGATAGGGGSTPTPTPTSTSTPGTATCSLSSRKAWALDQLQEWYLFPSLLDDGINPDSYADLQSYIDALVAPARAQGRDRYFTYLTSIEEENAFYEQGASAGFGFRLYYDSGARRVYVLETFENTTALGANIDRGSELLAIGTSEATLETVNSLMASGGARAVVQALGPDTVGTTRVIRVRDQSGIERTVSLSKTDFAIDPVSNRYGYSIINDGGRQVGYVNLRTFIDPAAPDLRDAFNAFRNAGVTELVIDFRYNGGGLVNIAELMGDLMGRELSGQVFDQITFRSSKSQNNSTYRFSPVSQSVAPTSIAFITTGNTASASEMVINGMKPYLPNTQFALIGGDTYGKPVGQIAIDQPSCDDRLRVIAFALQNADGDAEYYNGLASTIDDSCRAADDLTAQLGDPAENMLAVALDYLEGGQAACTAFSATARAPAAADRREPLMPERPNTVKREVPGLF